MGVAPSRGPPALVVGDLRGKHFVVTGASSGIGFTVARELAKMGARVTMLCRNATTGAQAKARLRQEALRPTEGLGGNSDGRVDVHLEVADFQSLQEVQEVAERLRAGPQIDVLVHAAAVLLTERRETRDGIERMMQVNHVAPHLLTRLLESHLRDWARVVFVSCYFHHHQPPTAPDTSLPDWSNLSGSAETFDPWQQFGRSKLGNVWAAQAFGRRLVNRHTLTYAVDPGRTRTALGRHLTDWSLFSTVAWLIGPLMPLVCRTPLEGADGVLYCAVEPTIATHEHSGRYWVDRQQVAPSPLAQAPENSDLMFAATEGLLAQHGAAEEKYTL